MTLNANVFLMDESKTAHVGVKLYHMFEALNFSIVTIFSIHVSMQNVEENNRLTDILAFSFAYEIMTLNNLFDHFFGLVF
jgi:hypothetical protein